MAGQCKDLVPKGWERREVVRKSGTTRGRIDVYIDSPNGSTFRSKPELERHIKKQGLSCKIEDFTFSQTKTENKVQIPSTSDDPDLAVDIASGSLTASTPNSTANPRCSKEVNQSMLDELNTTCESFGGTSHGMNSTGNISFLTEEEFVHDPSVRLATLENSLLDLSEKFNQLKHDKDKAELSLINLEKEAEVSILQIRAEVHALKAENTVIMDQLVQKDRIIATLNSHQHIDAISTLEGITTAPRSCDKCNTYSSRIGNLELEIKRLKEDNLKLMDTILPYPSPDKNLKTELDVLKKNMEALEKKSNDNLNSFDEIVKVLSLDLERLSAENSKLRSNNETDLKEQPFDTVQKKIGVSKQVPQNCIKLHNKYDCLQDPSQDQPLTEHVQLIETEKLSSNIAEEIILASKKLKKNTFMQTKPNTDVKNITRKSKSKVLVLADSHGRYLASNLKKVLAHENPREISSIFKPNANFEEVVKDAAALTRTFSKEDYLIVLGGSNDSIDSAAKTIINCTKKLLEATKHTNIIMCSIPHRYDLTGVNDKISLLNMAIENLVESREHAVFMSISDLPRYCYTRYGLHYNKNGKMRVAYMIKDLLLPGISRKPGLQITAETKKEDIRVVEADMCETIKNCWDDQSVAFAHTISKDLNVTKSMSAGVAVIFKKLFGKPLNSDFVDSKLTLQQHPGGALIFSLVTKEQYFGKPLKKDYDEAFDQLAHQLRSKKIKTLICSPMGCVRDKIKLEHFANNIAKLQKNTGVKVYVVSYDQRSARKLRHGLSHPEFLKKLEEEIANSRSKQESMQEREPQTTCVLSIPSYVNPLPSLSAGPQSFCPKQLIQNSNREEDIFLLDLNHFPPLV